MERTLELLLRILSFTLISLPEDKKREGRENERKGRTRSILTFEDAKLQKA